MTTFHACLDIHHGVIRHARAPRNLDGLLKDAATGKPMTGEQVLDHAIHLAEQGFEAIPVGCNNHDGQGRCLGHADANNVATTNVPEPSIAIVLHLDKLAWLLAEGVLILKDRNPDDANWFAQAEAALDLIHKQGITSNLPLENDAAVEAIQFALNNDEGLAFLRCWNEGDFQAIRDEWPEAPEEVFIGADPLHRKEPERALEQQFAGYMHASGNLNAVPDPDGDRRYLVLEASANPAGHHQSAESVLAHCPFCGQQDAFVEQLDSDASVVVCQGRISEHSACLARGPVGVRQGDCEEQPGYDKAVEEWNRRAAFLSASPTPANCCNCGACPAGCVAAQRASV
ncbi:Lar family restriction alleviation protein [Pseudomonas shahriarae]|uniref:Lar family restriction alleviation protein n=1 Tax=Pseudomonas shahriarae TaxID=2745512 RepID=UPI0023609A16|nr:hypothetical protein [Pseudomonas shahriarae]MDD0981332.1 hypothetical protein [Pseudomonas shahriarae]